MPKKRTEHPCNGPDLAVGAHCLVGRPNMWSGYRGVVKSVKDHKHIVRVKSLNGDFDIPACGSELTATPFIDVQQTMAKGEGAAERAHFRNRIQVEQMKPFATELKAWRKRTKLSQEDAAREIGVRVDRYRKWEQNKCEPEALVIATISEKFFQNGK